MLPGRGGLESWYHEALGCMRLILSMVALCPGSLSHPQVPGARYTLWLRPQRFCPFPRSWEIERSPEKERQLCPGA